MTVDVVGHAQQNLIYEFNYLPARYLHDSWWVEIPNGNVLKFLRENERIENRVSEIITKTFKIDEEYSFNIDDKLDAIGLKSANEINELLCYLGLLYAGHQVNQVITKIKLLEYEELIGNEKYTFIRNVAETMRDSIGIKDPGLPAVNFEQFMPYVQRVGLNIFAKAMSEKDTVFRKILMLKLGTESKKYLVDEKALYQVSISLELSQSMLLILAEHLRVDA